MARSFSFDSDSRYAGQGVRSTSGHYRLIAIAAIAVLAYSLLSFVNYTAPEATLSGTSLSAETSSVATDASYAEAAGAAVISDAAIAESSSLLVESEAPGTETISPVIESAAPSAEAAVAVVEVAPAIPVVAPAVVAPAVVAPAVPVPAAGPVERWAATGVIFVVEGQEWDERSLANVDAALSQLPRSVLNRLGNRALGPLYIVVNTAGRTQSGSQPYGGAANYFSTNEGRNELVLYPGQSVSTVLHELGHAYNLRNTPAGQYGRVLSEPEMQTFMAATGWEITSPPEMVARAVDHMSLSYAYTGTFNWPALSHFDPLEDFANSFAMYYTDRSGLAAISPERHGWMAANLPR